MAMMHAIEQEHTDELLVITTLLKEALRRDNLKHGEVSDYVNCRGLYLDRNGNIEQKNNQDDRNNRNLEDDRLK